MFFSPLSGPVRAFAGADQTGRHLLGCAVFTRSGFGFLLLLLFYFFSLFGSHGLLATTGSLSRFVCFAFIYFGFFFLHHRVYWFARFGIRDSAGGKGLTASGPGHCFLVLFCFLVFEFDFKYSEYGQVYLLSVVNWLLCFKVPH